VEFLKIFIITLLLSPAALAESGQMALESSRMLTQAAQQRANICAKIKADPNCVGREGLLRAATGMNVTTCRAEVQRLRCADFFQKFPNYKNNAMSCAPTEICKLGLDATLFQGCKRYGIEVKDGFLAFLNSEAECSTQWKCLLGRSLTMAYAAVLPGQFIASRSGEMSKAMIDGFKSDRDRLEKMACLDAETQAQFQCYLGVKYGGMILGTAGAARAAGAGLMARMAAVERNLVAAETRVAAQASRTAASDAARSAETKAPRAPVVAAVPAEVKELQTYIRDLYPKELSLDIVNGKGVLRIGYLSSDDPRLAALMTRAVRSGGINKIEAGKITGPKVLTILTRLRGLQPADAPLRITGSINMADVQAMKVSETTRAQKSHVRGFNWSEREITNYDNAVRDLRLAEACRRVYSTSIERCGNMRFSMDARNPQSAQWTAIPD
jgi:hypothetical protein